MDSLDKPVVLAAGPYQEQTPRLSPDGQFVAYVSFRTGVGEIYIRPIAENGEEVRVTSRGGSDPVWSRDGHELFFIEGASPGDVTASVNGQLMAARVTTSPKIVIADMRSLFPFKQYLTLFGRSSYDVFPNGDFLMLATQSDSVRMRSTTLVVRTNFASSFGERQQGRTP
jgi:Tol biopolymer transport system component